MDAQKFIQLVASGEASSAKDTLTDILSSKAFESLDIKKQEIAQTLYNNGENIEVQNTADSEIEEDELLTQEEFEELSDEDQELYLEALEQIDEISIETMKSAKEKLGNKAFNAHYDDNKRMAQNYAQRAMSMKSRIAKKQREMGSEKTNEDVEQLDEIGDTPAGKKALGSYVKKRTNQLPKIEVGYQMAPSNKDANMIKKYKSKVTKGIGRAVDRLTK